MLGELAKSWWLDAHHSKRLLGLSCQLCSQHRCWPHLLGHFVRSLLVPLRFPHVSSPRSSGSITPAPPSLGSSMVVHHLHRRVSADLEDLSTLHRAGVDENHLASWSSPEATALVDEPLVDNLPAMLVLIQVFFRVC